MCKKETDTIETKEIVNPPNWGHCIYPEGHSGLCKIYKPNDEKKPSL